ncbi:hypothetical protein FB567DRAFT_591221 [Paraphoma chrysanthemicola]|uniref:ATPase synthesis protein 25 n=1 Tax=Paraphoma chrysanthemicola TaxID=798071 RepID=A0A8K0VZU3_9PLEO|nr:hypothetical protein FB567DRAFT_591221 [Paraphoma chrysanthemicola]
MSLFRTTSSRYVCRTCQQATARPSQLRSFTSSSFAPAPPRARRGNSSRCTFSTSVARSKDRNDVSAVDPEFVFLDNGTEPPTTAIDVEKSPSTSPVETSDSSISMVETVPTPPDASVPWYLRQQSSVRDQAQQPIEIPDLPPNPPPLLKTILEYISITAGLDDIELLDLRHLDPPPALGPKLIMIIATARSEKHLHVSADRFARYLRREHNLKANAAGLLGRNELKIKLRRKAKRMRMLANVGGAVPEGNIDDGIRTGWICCTLSKIEAHPDDMHMPGDNVQEFVGFRDVKPGVNVVVQMFTEEKRAETDLETLWGGVLRTHQRQDKAIEEKLKELEDDIEGEDERIQVQPEDPIQHQTIPPKDNLSVHGNDSPSAQPFARPQSTAGDIFPPPSSESLKQSRRLHSVGLR